MVQKVVQKENIIQNLKKNLNNFIKIVYNTFMFKIF
jgi:hypothetical protein